MRVAIVTGLPLTLVEGNVYSILLDSATINRLDLSVNLRDSTGGFIASSFNNSQIDILTFTATETGTFFVEVEGVIDGLTNSLIGDYELTVYNAEDDFSADVNTTGVLTADGTVTTGSIDVPFDRDRFALQVTEGELYNLELTSSDLSLSNVVLRLRESDGSSLQSSSDVLSFIAPSTGTVFIDVAPSGEDNAGDYAITANVIEDDFSADVNTTGVLTADGSAISGSIDVSNDIDWFALQVTEGELYSITFTSSDFSRFDADLDLYDSNGSFLQDGSDILRFTAQSTGTVFIQTDVSGSGIGDYELTTEIFEDDFSADTSTTGVLPTDGTVTTGSIDIERDGDWFAIDLVEGLSLIHI